MIKEMNVAGGPGNTFGYGGAGGSIGTHGGSVGNDADAWKNTYTNVPIHYLHGDGKKKTKKKKKGDKKEKGGMHVYRRAFAETMSESLESDHTLNCLLYTENNDYLTVMVDILEKLSITHEKDEHSVLFEGADAFLNTVVTHMSKVLTTEPFEQGEIVSFIGEMCGDE